MKRANQSLLTVVLIAIAITLCILLPSFWMEPSQISGFISSIIGAAVGGGFAVMATIVSFAKQDNDRVRDDTKMQLNHARLIISEVKVHKLVIENLMQLRDPRVLENLSDTSWVKVNTECAWMADELFERLCLHYQAMRTFGFQEGATALNSVESSLADINTNISRIEAALDAVIVSRGKVSV